MAFIGSVMQASDGSGNISDTVPRKSQQQQILYSKNLIGLITRESHSVKKQISDVLLLAYRAMEITLHTSAIEQRHY